MLRLCVNFESMQKCGVVRLKQRLEPGLQVAESLSTSAKCIFRTRPPHTFACSPLRG
jgi:hypothetical protein